MTERIITYLQAVHEGLQEEMRRDPTIFIMGEDITGGYGNGDFGVTKGFLAEFGPSRVRDTPICENAIVGTAIGAALGGARPVAEIMYIDFLPLAMNPIINIAPKLTYLHKVRLPIVIRTPTGGGIHSGPSHSQSLESFFMHIPGWDVVVPSTPKDAKGMIKTALRGEHPALIIEHKMLYGTKGPTPDEDYTTPFGEALIAREGRDVTVVGISIMTHRALEAANILSKEGISIEVIDLRSLAPLDDHTIVDSVSKTGRLLIVEEGAKTGGIGAEVAARVAEKGLEYLDAPINRLANPDTQVPCSPALEDSVIPQAKDVVAHVKKILNK
jgi:pyruvate dehydrogenase E1 component beta subunit